MNWDLIAPWLNRIGMILEFISVWLVAPELIGEERLLRLENKAESYLGSLKSSVSTVFNWLNKGPVYEEIGRIVYMPNDLRKNKRLGCIGFILGNLMLFCVAIPILFLWGTVVLFLALFVLFLEKVLERLANDQTFRRRVLLLGVFTYIFAFMLEMIATF